MGQMEAMRVKTHYPKPGTKDSPWRESLLEGRCHAEGVKSLFQELPAEELAPGYKTIHGHWSSGILLE